MKRDVRRRSTGLAVLGLVAVVGAVGLGGCSRPGAESGQPQPGSSRPLSLTGQRVVVLPVQSSGAVPVQVRSLEGEIVFALAERDPGVVWLTPEEVRSAARRSPLFAGNPDALPSDAMLHHGERRVVEPLAGELRRLSALLDARLLLLPRLTAFAANGGEAERLHLSAVVVDARSGDVLWLAELPTSLGQARERSGLAELAGNLAQRLVGAGPTGAQR